jgi:hypothetical protein
LETRLGSEILPQHLGRVLNLATAGTRKIASKQGLEHQHQRIPAIPSQPLNRHMPKHSHHLANWNTHATNS